MRNRRLLTLAVLAVTIGFAAYAQADYTPPVPYYGTAVVTLIQRGGGTFDINVRLWDDAGIGESADANTAGLVDFSIASIKGIDGATVTNVWVTAPLGEVRNDANTIILDAGFTKELIKSSAGVFNVTSVQPAMYGPTPPGTNVGLCDAAILIGVGTTGYEVGGDPQDANGLWTDGGEPGDYAGDTPIVHGTYTGDGILGVITAGTMAFSAMPTAAPYNGPMPVPGTASTVKAVVIQTITGPDANSNDGGAAELTGDATARMRVEVGNIILGEPFIGGANVTLQVSDANTSVTMTSDHTFGGTDTSAGFGGLDIRPLNDGKQVVNVGTALIAVYTPDPAQTLINIKGDESTPGMLGDANDGLYSSAITDPYDPEAETGNEVLVVALSNPAVDEEALHVVIRATILGDTNLNGFVNFTDFAILDENWLTEGGWTQGDFNGNGYVNFTDFSILDEHWLQAFGVFAPPVPEPATLSLLCLGALGLLRRRRS